MKVKFIKTIDIHFAYDAVWDIVDYKDESKYYGCILVYKDGGIRISFYTENFEIIEQLDIINSSCPQLIPYITHGHNHKGCIHLFYTYLQPDLYKLLPSIILEDHHSLSNNYELPESVQNSLMFLRTPSTL